MHINVYMCIHVRKCVYIYICGYTYTYSVTAGAITKCSAKYYVAGPPMQALETPLKVSSRHAGV